MDQDISAMLHQTLPGPSSINKKKKYKMIKHVSKYSKEESIIIKELRLLEDKVHQLTQAKRYLQKGEESELNELISLWRSSCQDITKELLGIIDPNRGRKEPPYPANLEYDYYISPGIQDDGYECELSSLDEDIENKIMESQQHQYYHDDQMSEAPEDEENDMTQLLSKLHIDPELIHYSIENDEFYE